ncbi:MAG: adhesin transport system membrane fusion protein [Paracoccaceae bacterium]|jgi:adhesin transport system membrane fusion protein
MSGALDTLLTRRPQRGWGAVSLLIIVALGAAVVWASFTRLDEVAVAAGEVVPQGQTKVVQHLEGGIVRELAVRDGAKVKAGDILLRLTLGAGLVNRAELQVRRDGLALRRARLAAEASGGDLVFPDEAADRQPQITASERAAYAGRKRELGTAGSVLAEQLSQRQSEIRELRANDAALVGELRINREKLGISSDLLKDGLTSRLEHLDAQRDVGRIEGERRAVSAKIAAANAAFAEAQARLRELGEKFATDVRAELGTVEVDLRRADELMTEATEQKGRADIRSPIDGTIKNLRYNTIGGVVRPGEPILEIVPARDRLVIEARLDPADRGYVRPGQSAIVKLSTYDFVRYGGLEGRVVRIAPDTDSAASTGRPFFRVVVETEKTWLGPEQGLLPISTGMEATVDIKTGRRTVIDYLLRPILKLRSEAFRER